MDKNRYTFTKEEIPNLRLGTQGTKYEGFIEQNEKFYYDSKELVFYEDVLVLLRQLYYDPQIGFRGRDSFYDYIKERYIGISRRTVMEYLKHVKVNQVYQAPQSRPVYKSIAARISGPHIHWQVDVTYMPKSSPTPVSPFFFVIVAIDVFSKYAYAKRYNVNTMHNAAEAIEIFVRQNEQEFGHRPKVIQTDNGPEFQGDFNEKLAILRIKHIYSKSHSPQTQGCVERFNGTMKRWLSKVTYVEEHNNWLRYLPIFLSNYNNQVHSATGQTPHSLQTAAPNIIQGAKEKIEKKAISSAKARNSKLPDLNVGDYVRLSLDTNKKELARAKGMVKKSLKPNWTSTLFRVVRISAATNEFTSPQYFIESRTSEVMGPYWRHRLLKILKPYRQPPPGTYLPVQSDDHPASPIRILQRNEVIAPEAPEPPRQSIRSRRIIPSSLPTIPERPAPEAPRQSIRSRRIDPQQNRTPVSEPPTPMEENQEFSEHAVFLNLYARKVLNAEKSWMKLNARKTVPPAVQAEIEAMVYKSMTAENKEKLKLIPNYKSKLRNNNGRPVK